MGLFLISSTAIAKATLRIPVIFELGKHGTAADTINRKLKKIGAKQIPTHFEISNTENGYDKLKKIDSDLSNAISVLGKDYRDLSRLTGTMPGSISLGGLKTCFKGSGKDVADAVLNLVGYEYTEQMNIWGWKYKNTTKLLTDFPGQDLDAYLDDNSKLWKYWRSENDSVLLLMAISDDGDDINETVIKRCE